MRDESFVPDDVSPYDPQIKRWDEDNDAKEMCLQIDMKHLLNYESATTGTHHISNTITTEYIS